MCINYSITQNNGVLSYLHQTEQNGNRGSEKARVSEREREGKRKHLEYIYIVQILAINFLYHEFLFI